MIRLILAQLRILMDHPSHPEYEAVDPANIRRASVPGFALQEEAASRAKASYLVSAMGTSLLEQYPTVSPKLAIAAIEEAKASLALQLRSGLLG